jgi:hypothetical protein
MEAKTMKRKTMTNISGGAHRAEVFCVEEEPAMPPLWQDEFNRACDAFLMQRETESSALQKHSAIDPMRWRAA